MHTLQNVYLLWDLYNAKLTCAFRLREEGRVAMTMVVHVDIFAVVKRERCDF